MDALSTGQIFHATPAREFSHAPFWFWNDELSEAEIARQLDDFQAHGVHAFVIHPRAGLPVHLGWMSDELLKMMRFAIEEAARRDMWVLLYDEAMYPSGSSAGQVAAESPAYACRGLVQVDLTDATPGETRQGVQIGQSGVELADDQTLVAEVARQRDQSRLFRRPTDNSGRCLGRSQHRPNCRQSRHRIHRSQQSGKGIYCQCACWKRYRR